MGYTKILQYADITHIYEYEKQIHNKTKKRKTLSRLEKARRKARRALHMEISSFSKHRTKTRFFQTVAHSLYEKGKPALITLTLYNSDVSITEAFKYINNFKKNVKNKMGEDFSYIAVPEFGTKKGRLHFHLLAWGLSEQKIKEERDTRNFQRQYRRGFLDVRIARDSSPKLATYLSKYLTKALSDTRFQKVRAYSTSRAIIKPRTYGSNQFAQYATLFTPEKDCMTKKICYDTKYLGNCKLTIYKNEYPKRNS